MAVMRQPLAIERQEEPHGKRDIGLLFVAYLTSQQHASVSQDGSAQTTLRPATQIEVADQTFHLTQSQYTDTGPTNPCTDPITPSAWQGIATGVPIFKSLVWLDPEKSRRKWDSNPGSSALEADAFTTRPTRRWDIGRSRERKGSQQLNGTWK